MKLSIAFAFVLAALATSANALPSQLVLGTGPLSTEPEVADLLPVDVSEIKLTKVAEDADEYARIKKTGADMGLKVPGSDAQASEPGSGWVWQSCGLDADVVRVDRVDVIPDPPRSGQNMTVQAAGDIKALVDAGSFVDVVVKLGLIRLLSKRFDLCEIARENDAQLQCPLKPGYYEIEHTVQLPRGIPPAKFNVHLTGTSQTELDLLCLDLSIDFGRH